MARIWSTGFELQSTTSGMEWDTTTGSPSISTSIKNVGGSASLRSNPTAATAYLEHATRVDSTVKVFLRYYIYVTTLPASDTTVLQLLDSTPQAYISIKITSTGTLKVWNETTNTQIGTTSSAISTGAWQLIELSYDDSNVNNLVTLKLNGSAVFTDATGDDANGWGRVRLGVVTSATCDVYFDDFAVNDTSGSDQTGFPGAGSIKHLKPDAAGDNSDGTLTGAATRWEALDETTPNDATDYVALTSTANIVDVNVETLGGATSIALVAVGHRASMASAAAGNVVLRVKSASGGTVSSSSNVVRNTTAWSTHDDSANVKQYKLTLYTDPTTSVAWTATGTNSIENMQIGFTSSDVTPNPRVTALWAMVDYVPSTDVDYDVTVTAQYAVSSTAPDVTKTAQYYVFVAASDVTKSAQYLVASTPSDVTKSADYVVFANLTITKTAQYAVVGDGSDIAIPSTYSLSIPEVLSSGNLKTLKIGKKYGPITSVILGRVPQNDNILISNIAAEVTTVGSVDTATDLITITAHALTDGTFIRLRSTGTLPVPLLVDTNYYVFTSGDPDTFALTETYADALTGSNLINITSVGSGTITLDHLETQEVQINNNQIMDDDRQTLLPEIYASVVGLEWNEVKAETVGLGWHEVGDVVIFRQGAIEVYGFISEVHLVLAGSVKESLVSTIPNAATVNYQTAGGILKTVYNTEIKVDKQQNEITSVVSQQDVYETETLDNFTEVYQNIENIALTIQKSGGGNLILNSVGFATESALDAASTTYTKLSFWDYNPSYNISTHGVVDSYSSSESQNAGGISGQVIRMVGTSVYIEQRVDLAADTPLSFALRIKNLIGDGDATITLYNDNDTQTITINDTVAYDWEEVKVENFTSTMPWLNIKIQVTSAAQFVFTDLRLLYGNTLQGWVQSSAELLSTDVQFTKLGMKIFDNVHDTETQVTYNEFSTRRKADGVVLFEADDSGVVTNDLAIKGSTSYYSGTDIVIKQITIPDGSALAGIAFIKVV